MKIYLIGLPSSGKTTLGKQLAQSVKGKFIDMDERIEKKTGKSIPEIFKKEGEEHFRKIEHDVLFDIIMMEDKNQVIATGGGAPCFFDNMALLNADGISIYLKVSPQELVKRLSGTGTDSRPLLKGKKEHELEDEIKAKLADRDEFYAQAHVTLDGDQLHINDLINAVKYATD